jgi:hypothetical protein
MSEINCFYPCDGLPNAATPPMDIIRNDDPSWAASGGLLHMYQPHSDTQIDNAWWGAWRDISPTTLEFEVSFPRMEYLGLEWEQISCRVYTASNEDANHMGVCFLADLFLGTDNGEQVIVYSGLTVWTQTASYYAPSLLSSWTGKVIVKNPTTHLVDVYLNDVLVLSDVIAVTDQAAFNVQLSGLGDSYVDLDYFNAYIDRPPPATVHSFPWWKHFQMCKVKEVV